LVHLLTCQSKGDDRAPYVKPEQMNNEGFEQYYKVRYAPIRDHCSSSLR